MRFTCLNVALSTFTLLLSTLFCFGQQASSDAVLEYENAWVRIVRVHYDAHEKTAMHDHPATPTVYLYTTDGGRLRISHDDEKPILRPPVKAGGIRFQRGVAERHVVEELDGIPSEYLRVELKTKPVDLPEKDVRRAPDDSTPYDSGMIRITRGVCAPHAACPSADHSEWPAVVVRNRHAQWIEPGSAPLANASDDSLEFVRIELKTAPADSHS